MQNKNLILYIIIIVLLLALIGGGFYLFIIKKPVPVQCIDKCGDGACQEMACQENGCPCVETINNCPKDCEEIQIKGDQIMIKWDERLSDAYIWKLFDSSKLNLIQNREKVSDFFGRMKVYKLGTISEGKYINKNLYRLESPCGELCMGSGMYVYILIENDYNPVLLTKYSDEIQANCEDYGICWGDHISSFNYISSFNIDDKTEIANLEPPNKIQIPNSEMLFFKDQNSSSNLITMYSDVKKIFDFAQNRAIYKTVDGCFMAKANDSTVRRYYFGFGFFEKEGEDAKLDRAIGVLNARWSDRKQNTQEYMAGAYECYDYASYVSDISQLVEIGTTGNGYKLYEPKDKNSSVLKQMYDNYYPGYDSETNQQKEKISYEEFLSMHPLVLWQDPFGEFIQFKDVRYAPLAERAKPVIYLYPEKETDVSVLVNPSGGFTFTEPKYKNGWKVKAGPDGEIYNYDDKRIYPYLFWEGKELNYKDPEQGFVVAKENIKKFLEEKLSQLGLIKKEYDEFIEFWLPKMQDKKYYFISFAGKEEIDNGAPLFISPKPDTVIRILMDYQGMDEYKNVEEPKIITPERKGFVVVEWGGVLHK